jgi:hypothetical protein
MAGICETAVMFEGKETDCKVQLYAGGKCAVIIDFFLIAFAIGSEKQTVQGRDMFFLVRRHGSNS